MHQGKFLQKKVKELHYPKIELANAMGVSRNTIYVWFRSEELQPENLVKLGKILNYDFIAEFYKNDKSPDVSEKIAHLEKDLLLEKGKNKQLEKLLEEKNQKVYEHILTNSDVIQNLNQRMEGLVQEMELMNSAISKKIKSASSKNHQKEA